MDWTTCPSRTVVPIEALQQIIFNVYSAVLERVIRIRVEQQSLIFFSYLSPILDKYVLQSMGVLWSSLLSALGWSCLLYGLQHFIFEAGRANIERMVRDQGLSTHFSSSSPDCFPSLTSMCRSRWERTLSTYLFSSPWAQLESRGRVGRFSPSAKVQKLPASCRSSELSAHQMPPSRVIAHVRGRPALEPMEILSSVQWRARCTPLKDGDSEPRRSSPHWTFSLRFLIRAFPLLFGFPILLFMTYLRYYGVCYGGTQLFLATAYATVRSYSWVFPNCVCVSAHVHHCKGVLLSIVSAVLRP